MKEGLENRKKNSQGRESAQLCWETDGVKGMRLGSPLTQASDIPSEFEAFLSGEHNGRDGAEK